MKLHFFLLLPVCIAMADLHAQSIGEGIEDERALYAETKQVNQFLRRFNGEENVQGERYYPEDRQYHNRRLRKKYLPILFNLENDILTQELKEEFIDLVTDRKDPKYLAFHGGDWIAELKTLFTHKGQDKEMTLFLKLQEEKVGSKWIIDHIYFEPFTRAFNPPDTNIFNDKEFLHPLSHEVGFMNIFRLFNKPDSLEYYAAKNYTPDYLTLFLYEIKKGNLKFKTVAGLKFHFFQIDDWYFELSYFNRSGYNTGWLISNLMKIGPEDKKILMKYIYHE
ncbi:MAG: hypothetical protein R6T99_04625 [Bacteroidales bacterium]